MLIGELATASGLSREALRFYEQQGLIRARRLDNGYRDYPPEVVTLVQYIRTAQQLGFTLAEIGDRLPAIWDAAEPCARRWPSVWPPTARCRPGRHGPRPLRLLYEPNRAVALVRHAPAAIKNRVIFLHPLRRY